MLFLYYLLQNRLVKFFIAGCIAASLNLLLIYILVEKFSLSTSLFRNISNIISIGLSLQCSFFLYRFWVWSNIKGNSWSNKFIYSILIYNLSNIFPVLLRILLVFPLLDLIGIHYIVNTIVGIILSFFFNYLLSDDFAYLYKHTEKSKKHLPETLDGAVLNKSYFDILKPNKYTNLVNDENEFKLSIVIPAHNEENNIGATITSLSNTLSDQKINFEILVVNDNSTDGTEEILKNASGKGIRYINNYYPNGYGYAVRCGLENFKGQAVVIVMADSSDHPEDVIKYFNELIKGYDCVFGSRFLFDSEVYNYPIHKLILNRIGNMFIQLLFGVKYNDTTNAFKAYRKEVIEGISPLISHHFNLTVEMPLKAISRGFSYAVVPISWRNRTSGLSKLKIKEMGSRYLLIILSIFLEKILARGAYNRNN